MARILLAALLLFSVTACSGVPLDRKMIDFQDPKTSVVGVAVIISELAADRVSRQEPDDALATEARLGALGGAMNRYLVLSESVWENAERHEARRVLYSALRDIVGSRLDSLININGQLDIGLGLVVTEIDRAGKAAALREDILAMKEAVSSGAMLEETMIENMVKRFNFNVARVARVREAAS